MEKENKVYTKNSRKLLVISAFSALILAIATYAWFIGMRTVSVSSFDVTIASTDSLLLSLDGKKWSYEVEIGKDILDDVSYSGHTNSWGGEGLIPISTVGEMDPSSSRMKLFEKTSITATPGGYRLMSLQIDNTEEKELDGYVVFDLFVKNFSGTQYIKENNLLDEEAIYLTSDSVVGVSLNGTDGEKGVEGTGIENSVRVAIAQIGRVSGATTDVSVITGITCSPQNPDTSPVTGTCRTAKIWEPNDLAHTENAKKWYNRSCLKRIKADLTDKTSYTTACTPLDSTNKTYYPTYAVKSNITSADRVDIYDGLEYNGYTPSTLVERFKYFTDTDKAKEGIEREQFFSLAPNSITKLRVYVYIEGQDIDNYDFAAIGKKISVGFGFTKERFESGDIEYDGPDLDPAYDKVKPVITLVGDPEVTITKNLQYVDAGATASDNLEGNISSRIVVTNPVDTSTPGTYIVKYNVKDWNRNAADEVIRTVTVTE